MIRRHLQKTPAHKPSMKRIRAKPGKLTNLPPEILVEIMKRVDVSTINVMPTATQYLKTVFEKYESELPPPVTASDEATLSFISYFRQNEMTLVKNQKSTISKVNPSFSCVQRYLQQLNKFTFCCGYNLPEFFKAGTPKYKKLKKFIAERCIIKMVKISLPAEEHLAGNIADLFPRNTKFQIFIDANKLIVEPSTFLDRDIDHLTVTGPTPRNVVHKILERKHLKQLLIFCSEAVPLAKYVREWKRNQRDIINWKFLILDTTNIELSSIRLCRNGVEMLRISRRIENNYAVVTLGQHSIA